MENETSPTVNNPSPALTTPPVSGNENKKWVLVGALLIVLLIALGFFFWMRGNMKGVSSQSLSALVASGQNVSCSFSYDDPKSGKNSGVIFIANGKVRGDFISVVNGANMESHMISDGQSNYFWSPEMSGMGVRLPVGGVVQANGEEQVQGIDWSKNYNYSCSEWTADESQFTIPSDINFRDVQSMMGGQVPSGQQAAPGALQCSTCDQLSGEQKTQCRVMLQCQ